MEIRKGLFVEMETLLIENNKNAVLEKCNGTRALLRYVRYQASENPTRAKCYMLSITFPLTIGL